MNRKFKRLSRRCTGSQPTEGIKIYFKKQESRGTYPLHISLGTIPQKKLSLKRYQRMILYYDENNPQVLWLTKCKSKDDEKIGYLLGGAQNCSALKLIVRWKAFKPTKKIMGKTRGVKYRLQKDGVLIYMNKYCNGGR